MFRLFTKKDKPLATLRRAREYLKTGFKKGSWIVAGGRAWHPGLASHSETPMAELLGPEIMNANSCEVCGEGAIYLAAAHEGLTFGQARELIDLVTDDEEVQEYGDIPCLNDSPGVKRTTIMGVLERAEKRIDEETPI